MDQTSPDRDFILYNGSETLEIFQKKKDFHLRQARLPIEEKLRILIELQKAALTIRPNQGADDHRMVWQLQ